MCIVGKDVSLPILVFSFAEVGNLHQRKHILMIKSNFFSDNCTDNCNNLKIA